MRLGGPSPSEMQSQHWAANHPIGEFVILIAGRDWPPGKLTLVGRLGSGGTSGLASPALYWWDGGELFCSFSGKEELVERPKNG